MAALSVITGKEGTLWLGDATGDTYNTPGIGISTATTTFLWLDGWRLIQTRKFTKITARDYSYAGTVPGRYLWRVECRAFQDKAAVNLNTFFNARLLSMALEAETATTAEGLAGGAYKGSGWIAHIEVSGEAQGLARLQMVIEGSDRLNTGDDDELGT